MGRMKGKRRKQVQATAAAGVVATSTCTKLFGSTGAMLREAGYRTRPPGGVPKREQEQAA